MSQGNTANFTFEFKFACELAFTSSAEEDAQLIDKTHLPDDKELELSPLAREIQQQARQAALNRRSEDEIAEDDWSLYHLEVETMNNTPLAKELDRQSLDDLIAFSEALDRSFPGFNLGSLVTPTRGGFWPSRKYQFEVEKGTPIAFALPITTPLSFEPDRSDTVEVSKHDVSDADNEFERFLHNERLLRNAVATYPKQVAEKVKDTNLSKLLRSAKSDSNVAVKDLSKQEYSEHLRRESASVLNLYAQANKKDAEEDLLAEAIESPIPSPTRSIKHLPRCISSGNVDAMSMGIADLTDEEETRFVSPTKFDDIDCGYEADSDSDSGGGQSWISGEVEGGAWSDNEMDAPDSDSEWEFI